MAKYLKSGKSITEKENEDQKTKEIVENVLKQIEDGGDKAVRMLSEKFDDYSPTSFKLSDEKIDALICTLTERELSDIKFAQ